MRCSLPTIDFTDRQAPSAAVSANTFSVGFGKRTRHSGGVDRAAATDGEPGYPQH